MEKYDNTIIKKEAPISNSLDNILRCPECNIISSLKLYYKEGKPFIQYYCENNHKGDISLEEYMQVYNKHSLVKQKCEDCNKSQNEVKGDYYYCCKCNKFICYPCLSKHPNDDKHNSINYKKYDSFCKIHSYFYCFYCKKCRKNICIYCKPEHKSHEIIDNRFRYNKRRNNIRNR